MKVNLAQELYDIYGKKIMTPHGPEDIAPAPLTVRYGCSAALMAAAPNERALTLDQKMRRHRLGARIEHHPDSDIDLTAEDVVLLKEYINTTWPTAVVGPLVDAIDPQA